MHLLFNSLQILDKLMVQALIAVVVKCLNDFPTKGNVSDTMSASTVYKENPIQMRIQNILV